MNKTSIASCWICLDNLPNEFGQNPVRDCSCRGDDAGYAHLSCIIKYAEQKSSEATSALMFNEPWDDCPNCHQSYQHQLALDLANACIHFVERKFPASHVKRLTAYHRKLGRTAHLFGYNMSKQRKESERIAHKCLSIVEQMDKRDECTTVIASDVYGILGNFELCSEGGTEDSVRQAIKNYEIGKKLAESMGMRERAADFNSKIATLKTRFGIKDGSDKADVAGEVSEQLLETRKLAFELMMETKGEVESLHQGYNYALALKDAHYIIEAERLLRKLIIISQQFHGRDHDTTIDLDSLLTYVTTRIVGVDQCVPVLFRAIRYECDGTKCVVEGPILNTIQYEHDGRECVIEGPIQIPRVDGEETTLSVDADSIFPCIGTPVICHGLKNASHLNGKIGDVRSFDHGVERYAVHFEDRSITPKLVKCENLRILFELPDAVA
ncbi:hypothetical protein ACHAW6_001880 [Cyclotella cf. meneghiniana]